MNLFDLQSLTQSQIVNVESVYICCVFVRHSLGHGSVFFVLHLGLSVKKIALQMSFFYRTLHFLSFSCSFAFFLVCILFCTIVNLFLCFFYCIFACCLFPYLSITSLLKTGCLMFFFVWNETSACG